MSDQKIYVVGFLATAAMFTVFALCAPVGWSAEKSFHT